MSNAVAGYLPIPKNIYFNIPRLTITYRQKEVLRYIAGKVYEWPETRASMTVELASRYIEEAIGVAYQHVSSDINELEEAGYIKVEKSYTRGQGSLITLLPEKIKSVTNMVTNVVTETVTNMAKSVTDLVTNTKNISKNNNNNPIPSHSTHVVSSYINNFKETATKVVKNLFPQKESSNFTTFPEEVENLKGAAGPSPQGRADRAAARAEATIQENVSIEGVSAKFMALGIKALKDRKIIHIGKALQEIESEMATRKMNNPEYYFLGLCKKKQNFSSVVIENKSGAEKTEAEFKRIDREIEQQKDSKEVLQDYINKYPEEVYQAIQEVDRRPGNKFVTIPEIRAALYVQEFKKQYPDKA